MTKRFTNHEKLTHKDLVLNLPAIRNLIWVSNKFLTLPTGVRKRNATISSLFVLDFVVGHVDLQWEVLDPVNSPGSVFDQ